MRGLSDKILFLDWDGVMNSRDSWQRGTEVGESDRYYRCDRYLDPHHIAVLNEIVKLAGCDIVVTSTHRIHKRLIELREIMCKNSGCIGRVIDKTDRLEHPTDRTKSCPRGLEIQKWIDGYVRAYGKEPKIVIVDDDSDMEHLTHRLYRIRNGVGLQMEDVKHIVKMLEE